jgi:hypothetical protein
MTLVGALRVDASATTQPVTGTISSNINGLNEFQTSQYTIGVSAVQLTPSPLANRSAMSIKTDAGNTDTVYIGESNAVTTSTGYALFIGDVVNIDVTASAQVWAISSAANQLVYVIEAGD